MARGRLAARRAIGRAAAPRSDGASDRCVAAAQKETGPSRPGSGDAIELMQCRSDQKPRPTCANTVVLLPLPWPTVALAPMLASMPNRWVRTPNSRVP
jgi:hypothetical protein